MMNNTLNAMVKPVALYVTMAGSGGHPWPPGFVSRAMAQNIAVTAYEEPLSVTEISRRTGIPPYYVQDEVQTLVDHELMRQDGDTYQTDFSILRYNTYIAIEDALARTGEAMAEPLVKSIVTAKQSIQNVSYYTAGKSFEEQLWTLLPFAFREVKHSTAIPSPESHTVFPQRKDGGKWHVYALEKRGHASSSIAQNMTGGYNGKVLLTIYTVNNVCNTIKYPGLPSVASVELLYDIANRRFLVSTLPDAMKEPVSLLLAKKLVRCDADELLLNIVYMRRPHYDQLRQIIGGAVQPCFAELDSLRHEVFGLLKQATPRHLHGQLQYDTDAKVSNVGAYALRTAYQQGLLPQPDDPISAGIFLLERYS